MGADRATWEWYGTAGHFICSSECRFHLCTKVGNYLVSTVGEYFPAVTPSGPGAVKPPSFARIVQPVRPHGGPEIFNALLTTNMLWYTKRGGWHRPVPDQSHHGPLTMVSLPRCSSKPSWGPHG